MRRPLAALAVTLCTAALALPSHADDPAVRLALNARYAGVTMAFQRKDFKALDRMLTPDYTVTLPSGKTMDRRQALGDLVRQASALTDVVWTRKIEKLTVKGNTAVADVRGHMTATMPSRNGPPRKLVFDALTRDTWVLTGRGSMLKHSQLLESRVATPKAAPAPPAPRRKAK